MAEGELAKVTSKGQMTIPYSVREELGIEPSDYVMVRVVDGLIVVKKADLSEPETGKALLDHLVRGIGRELEEKYGVTDEEQLGPFIEAAKQEAYQGHYGSIVGPDSPGLDGDGR